MTIPFLEVEDPWGALIKDLSEGGAKETLTIVRDGLLYLGGELLLAEEHQWPDHEREAIKWLYQIESGSGLPKRVLDIGCGAGRLGRYLETHPDEKNHFEVHGIDGSTRMVQYCHQRGLGHTHIMSLDDLPGPLKCYDAVVMLDNGIGLFTSAERLVDRLRVFHQMTYDWSILLLAGVRPPGGIQVVTEQVRYGSVISPKVQSLEVSVEELNPLANRSGWMVDGRVLGTQRGQYIARLVKNRVQL